MEIVKKKNAIHFKHQDSLVEINVDSNSQMDLIISRDSESVNISNPGEYEYFGVNLTALEVPKEGIYSSQVDMLNVSVEGNIDTLFLFKPVELNEYVKDKFKSINVFVSSVLNVALIKNVIKTFQPEKIVILPDFNQANTEEFEKVKSEFGNMEKANSGKIKFKEAEFNSTEDTIQNFYIL